MSARPDPTTPTAHMDPCPSCGAPVGGRAGCQAVFDELSARAWEDPLRGSVHNLVVDTYAMQHPEEYGRSVKSYITHLTALCCGVEFGGDAKLYWRISRWLDGNVRLEKPPVLRFRGARSIADVKAARETAAYVRLVRAWAQDVWAAYAPQQDLARGWVGQVRAAGQKGMSSAR